MTNACLDARLQAQAAEQALEQDSQRFEEYLKENDAKLQVGRRGRRPCPAMPQWSAPGESSKCGGQRVDVYEHAPTHSHAARPPPRPPILLEQEALRAAEAAARARAEKAAEAKRLAASIAGTEGEMAKIEEQLQECQRCAGREGGDVVLSSTGVVRCAAACHAKMSDVLASPKTAAGSRPSWTA